jgi:CheY-like chemotaxis protein
MEAIGNLAGGVAHDFNNQLAGIMGYAELLGMKLDHPELKHYTENIIMAANRSADLTRKLLAFARRGRYQLLPVDMHKLLRNAVQALEGQMGPEIQVRQNLTAEHYEVAGDPAQLQTVLLNIGSNARDAMPNGGALLIETREMTLDQNFIDEYAYDVSPGNYICVNITDTGCGIPEETKKHIFEPFYTTKPVGKGTGMGLAAAYGIIKNHKGAISCSTEVGRGSTFTLYLPLTKPKKSAQPAAHERPAVSQAGLRILVVDDEPLVRDMLCITLESEGCKVSTAGDGREALTLYKNKWREIDLVILDMVLPEMSGRDIFRAMKQINPRVKTLLSSGYSIDGEARSILSEGVLGFIQKPFRKQDLMQLIGEVCPPQDKC